MLYALLHPIPIGFTLFTLFAPWRWVWRFWVIIAIYYLSYLAPYVRIRNPGFGYGLVVAVLLRVGLYIGALLTIRAIVRIWTVGSREMNYVPSKQIKAVDAGFLVIGGGFAASLCIGFTMWIFSGASYGYTIHTVYSIVSLTTLFLLLRSCWKKHYVKCQPTFFTAAFWIAIAIPSVYGFSYPATVIASAKDTANGQPYCIILYKQKRVVQTLEDLTLFTMNKNYRSPHAILFVQKRSEILRFHWSYYKGNIIDVVGNWKPDKRPWDITCIPRLNFAEDLKFAGRK